MDASDTTDDTQRQSALAPVSGAGWRGRLLGSLRRVGALAPDALAAGRALGEVTGVGHLALLPTLLSGFFGVCSPQGARVAEAQLLLLARELDAVRTTIAPGYFAQEGALQLLRDFIAESPRTSSDDVRARMRRVLVQGASRAAAPEHTRTLFGLATKLSSAEVELLKALHGAPPGAGPGSAAAALANRGEERADLATWDATAHDVLVREGLVREVASQREAPRAFVVTALGARLLGFIG